MRLGIGLAAGALLAGATPAPAAAPPARLLVQAKEWSLTLSRTRLRAGWAIVQLANFGEDPHDLALRRVGGTVTRRLPVTQSEDVATLRARLLPGRYELWCTLPGHRSRGMQARLVVTR